MPASPNLAQRAARWSAEHRWIAIGGWLALVVVCLFMGRAIGTQHLANEDLGTGESRQADRILANAGFNKRASEEVLIQAPAPGPTIKDPAFRAGIQDVVGRLRAFPTITDVKSPLRPENRGLISRDQRSALVQFDIKGDEDTAEERVDPILDAVAQLDRAHPQLRIEQFGDASANKALSKAFEDDFRKAETLSL